MANETEPSRGSKRVEKWIWNGINPLIRALENEAKLLDRGNLTWRHGHSKPDFLAPPFEYLDDNGVIHLEDLAQRLPRFQLQERLDAHARLVANAVQATAISYEALLRAKPGLAGPLTELLDEYRLAFQNAKEPYPDGDMVRAVAERLVNGSLQIPEHNQDARFWNELRPRIYEKTAPIAMNERKLAQAALDELRNDTVPLIAHLRDARRKLCDEFDVSPAP